MGEPLYIWGFPGIGKSSIRSKLNIVDADCKRFEFNYGGSAPKDLHGIRREGIVRSREYPQNYLSYIFSLDADAVLINCHISLLDKIPKESLILIYPSVDLKDEYLKRYADRGDSKSYIRYMAESFEDIVSAIEVLPFRKYRISERNIYLNDLLAEGGKIMAQFISKKELTTLLDEAIKMGVYTPADENIDKKPDELAQMLFEGEIDIDISDLRNIVAVRKEELKREALAVERRCGLTHEELADKIMQGIVNGTLNIYHGEIAPYHYGYEVTVGKNKFDYRNRWECYCNFSEVADNVVSEIERGRQQKAVFSSNTLQSIDVYTLLQEIENNEKTKIGSFIEEKKTDLKRRGRYFGDVATLEYVHKGIALDGIIQGHFNGDYSSITTTRQNDMLRTLVAMKGFCLDCISMLERPYQKTIIDYLKKHGTDITTSEKLQNWIKDNPDKCGLEHNRLHIKKSSLDSKITNAERSANNSPDKETPEHEAERE